MNFFIMGLAVACVLTFLAWRYFYDINIDLKDQLEDKQKQLDSSHEREKKTWKRYENCKLQLTTYESEIDRLKSEISKLESQLKHKTVEHRIIQMLPNSITLKGRIRRPQRLEIQGIDNMMKRIIAKDLVNQIVENDLIQIDTEIDPMQLEEVFYYKIVVQKKN